MKTPSPEPLTHNARRDAALSTALVIAFWWLVTGLLLGLPASSDGRQAAAIVASLVGGSGLALAILIRNDTAPRAAWLGFLAGGTLWAWAQAALYGGWLVGPGAAAAPATLPVGRLAQAIEVLRLTSWSEAASVGVLLLAGLIALGARNRTCFWTVFLLFAAHQVARVNVFLGVANASPELLPHHLAFLKPYFGPATNSPILWPSVLLWTVVAVVLIRAARRAPDLYRRRAALVLGVLAALAAVEHAVLGVTLRLPFWDLFTRAS